MAAIEFGGIGTGRGHRFPPEMTGEQASAVLARRTFVRMTCAAAMPGLLAVPGSASAFKPAPPPVLLDRGQSQRFRDWMTLLVHEQISRGPTPRWTHRDCAGLVRFSVAETLRPHDLAWRRANGLMGRSLPADVDPEIAAPLRNTWRRADGSRDAYVGALELVQENSRLITRQLAQARLGDLLFFDQGDEQHLMVWMDRYIAYHTGRVLPGDNGLRAVRPSQLLAWPDTRWRPAADNPNFAGVYRLEFLA